MHRLLWFAPLALLSLLALFFALGCDDANDPDLPAQPYSLAATYDPGTPIVDISADGNIVAVAEQFLGYDILNTTDLHNFVRLDSMRFGDPGRICEGVAVDGANGIIGVSVVPPVYSEIRDFVNHSYVAQLGATGVLDMHAFSLQDTCDMWVAQSGNDVRIGSTRVVRSSSGWTPGGNLTWAPLDNAVRMEHFSISDDGIVATTFQAGVHLINSRTLENLDTFLTPDQAFGTAWRGQYLLVVAEYSMLVYDASDLNNVTFVHRFEINGADRLRQVAVDGNYAALLDNNDGIYIVDVSNVTAPQLVQTISLIEPSSIEASDHRFYISDQARGLLIYTR